MALNNPNLNNVDRPDDAITLFLGDGRAIRFKYQSFDEGVASKCYHVAEDEFGYFGKIERQRWDAVIAINLSAPFHAIKTALPQMRRTGWGRIINIASAHGLVASREKSAYVAAKHGVVGLTKVVALETAGSGVTCNAICPAWVLTPLVQKQIDARAAALGGDPEAAIRQMMLSQPSGEFVTPEQIAGLVLFLCSAAAQQITGASITIDGGWTAQ